MNKNLVLLSDNVGTVTDEHGNIKVVTKENDNYELKDILAKENEVDNKKNELENSEYNLRINKIRIILGELLNIAVFGSSIIMYTIGRDSVSKVGSLVVAGLFYGTFRGLSLGMFGTRISKYRERKQLKANIKELDEEVPELEKELKNMKDKTRYSNEQDLILATNYPNYDEIISEGMKNPSTNQVKILSLTRNKNVAK